LGVKLDSPEFQPLLDHSKVYHWPRAFQIDSRLAKVFYTRVIDDFCGHASAGHPGCFILDIEHISVHDSKESQNS
jgi:hypothetical protein